MVAGEKRHRSRKRFYRSHINILKQCFSLYLYRRGGGSLLSPTAVRFDDEEASFLDLYNHTLQICDIPKYSVDRVEKTAIKATSSSSGEVGVSSLTLPLSLCRELQHKFVQYTIKCTDENDNVDLGEGAYFGKKDAFKEMMAFQTKTSMPPKVDKEKANGPERLYSDLISWASEFDKGWTASMMESGKSVFSALSKALWYIDRNHDKFERNGCPIPKVFQKFIDYNRYEKFHHVKPTITQEKLNDICVELSKCISIPSMTTESHKALHHHIDSLLNALIKYRDRLKLDNVRHKSINHVRTEPARNVVDDSTCKLIRPKEKVDKQYESLDEYMQTLENYEYIDLDRFSPEERIQRRKYIMHLQLSVPVTLFQMAYGWSIGTLSFVWTVPVGTSNAMDVQHSKTINEITSQMPKYSTRAMRKDFINRYVKFVKAPKSVLRHIFFELTSYETSYDSNAIEKVVNHIEDILLADDPQLLLDLRALNGKSVDEKYKLFFNELNQYFNEQLMPVNKRRHGDELYLPFAVSMQDLKSQISKRLPEGTLIPSTETIRLQFMPSNPFKRTSLKYTGKFNVKYQVQTRQGRVHHPDARYVATLFRYVKEFCVKYKDNALLVCLDDKAIVPVGEPGVHISTGVRGHNRVLGPADGANLVAADHDFHIAGIVPSVTLCVDTPSNSNDSFFKGRVFVTTKDKVFEASSPFRHATELVRILREHYSDNGVDLTKQILCVMTDGGPDHRLTFESVKASLLQLFLQLNLDMLIAVRTAPNHSWMNPAERCMSVLNYALQHVALSRTEMTESYEKLIKNKSSLNAVRNCASKSPGLKQAFADSMDPVLQLINERFARMKLKDEPFTVYRGVSEEEIDDALSVVRDVCHVEELTRESSSKDVRGCKDLQGFLRTHSISTHYSFQIMKCNGEETCSYCTMSPLRMDADMAANLYFLPCPVPDDQHYQSFEELYGTKVTEEHRPSLKNNTEFDDEDVETDRKNRDVFKSGKARDVLHCGECSKPRIVYSNSKLNRGQEEILKHIQEHGGYTCGADVPEDCGFVVKKCLTCASEVEVTYYSGNLRHFLPPCCIYCGDKEHLLDDNDEYIEKLFEHFSIVRPLCGLCREKGHDAKTWGKKFFKKRRI